MAAKKRTTEKPRKKYQCPLCRNPTQSRLAKDPSITDPKTQRALHFAWAVAHRARIVDGAGVPFLAGLDSAIAEFFQLPATGTGAAFLVREVIIAARKVRLRTNRVDDFGLVSEIAHHSAVGTLFMFDRLLSPVPEEVIANATIGLHGAIVSMSCDLDGWRAELHAVCELLGVNANPAYLATLATRQRDLLGVQAVDDDMPARGRPRNRPISG